ncbi:MAG: hypothetical protein L6R39_000341 [Caloplaca ligustica]|nr:MAG: hypothetical protein L6R39_000341 [Caloplaca ligustica]
MSDAENVDARYLPSPEIPATDYPDAPPLQPPSMSKPIVLQVGEQQFLVSRDTLSGSPVLMAKTHANWESGKQADGSYFLDLDPEAFKHVLRFLRHGVYPLCYDNVKGHDFALYAVILRQADFLLIAKLVTWLSARQYLKAVTVETSARVLEEQEAAFGLHGTSESDTKTQYHPSWKTKKRYVCPRGIAVHYDNPGACGHACRKAQGDAECVYDDCPVLSTLVVKEKTAFNRQLCIED